MHQSTRENSDAVAYLVLVRDGSDIKGLANDSVVENWVSCLRTPVPIIWRNNRSNCILGRVARWLRYPFSERSEAQTFPFMYNPEDLIAGPRNLVALRTLCGCNRTGERGQI